MTYLSYCLVHIVRLNMNLNIFMEALHMAEQAAPRVSPHAAVVAVKRPLLPMVGLKVPKELILVVKGLVTLMTLDTGDVCRPLIVEVVII